MFPFFRLVFVLSYLLSLFSFHFRFMLRFCCAGTFVQMAAIFPILDVYSCIATKWTRHLGFCVTYTALLMKTWRYLFTLRFRKCMTDLRRFTISSTFIPEMSGFIVWYHLHEKCCIQMKHYTHVFRI